MADASNELLSASERAAKQEVVDEHAAELRKMEEEAEAARAAHARRAHEAHEAEVLPRVEGRA